MTAKHALRVAKLLPLAFQLAYCGCVVAFLVYIASYYAPGLGFTRLIVFGDKFAQVALPEVKATPHYVTQGWGYDGQWYAQLAARPNPWDPELQRALDNPWYRSGRILPSLLACGLSFGSTTLAVHLYAAQYILVWLAIALLTLRWFPPGTLRAFCCWAGLLFSAGTVTAIYRALPDAWSFVLMLGAALLLEKNSRWAPLLMSGAGLARETVVLAAAAFVDRVPRSTAAAARMLATLAVALALPFAWHAALRLFGDSYALSGDAFRPPFSALYERILQAFHDAPDWRALLFDLAGPIALSAQAAFFVLRVRFSDWRWRLGAAHVPLLAVLGPPIWEGTPSAASRVMLPMLFAFNLTLPSGTKWWPWLLLGNFSVLSGLRLLVSPPPF